MKKHYSNKLYYLNYNHLTQNLYYLLTTLDKENQFVLNNYNYIKKTLNSVYLALCYLSDWSSQILLI